MVSSFRLPVLAMACLLAAAPAVADESGKPLSAAAIATLVAGRTIGDEAHWSYRFGRDGGLAAMDLGKTRAGHWRIAGRELCLEFVGKRGVTADCYEIRLAGQNIRFLRDGVVIFEGWILDQ